MLQVYIGFGSFFERRRCAVSRAVQHSEQCAILELNCFFCFAVFSFVLLLLLVPAPNLYVQLAD